MIMNRKLFSFNKRNEQKDGLHPVKNKEINKEMFMYHNNCHIHSFSAYFPYSEKNINK